VEGGPLERPRMGFDVVGARGHPIVHEERGGVENQTLSRRGPVFPRICVTKAGEGGGDLWEMRVGSLKEPVGLEPDMHRGGLLITVNQ